MRDDDDGTHGVMPWVSSFCGSRVAVQHNGIVSAGMNDRHGASVCMVMSTNVCKPILCGTRWHTCDKMSHVNDGATAGAWRGDAMAGAWRGDAMGQWAMRCDAQRDKGEGERDDGDGPVRVIRRMRSRARQR